MADQLENVPDDPTIEFTDSDVDEWFDSEETETDVPAIEIDIVKRYTEAQLRIVRSNLDLSLHNLRQSLKDANYINLSPPYQRRHRWDLKKKSHLIESLLLNIPIPPIFLYENNYNQYEIMDGRQRLEAIKDFLDNNYALKGMEYWKELDGTRFNDLPPTIQRGLLRRTVSAIVLLAETSRPGDSEIDVRMALFKRLNTGGVNLNPQELRNALYPSRFNNMLIDLSKLDYFRDTWGIPRFSPEEEEKPPKQLQNNALYKTMADCELVLRFFTIKETIIMDLKGSLRSLMDATMRRHAADDESAIHAFSNEFRELIAFFCNTFDGRPFLLPGNYRPSRPAYDALMVAASLEGIDTIKDRGSAIAANFAAVAGIPENYEIFVGRGNTIEAIKERVTLAKSIIQL